jgi:methylglutaconyl-CoA hydratase
MESAGVVSSEKFGGIATVTFAHPKSNSLPKALLLQLSEEITRRANESDVHVVLLKSGGDGAFCAGASFDELLSLENLEEASEFFMGFAKVMMALITSPVPTVVRVHGKVVGGGIGIVAACDYSLATVGASVRLSELSIGIGPFVIGPVVARRIGVSRFSTLALGGEWKGAEWCESAGLYSEVAQNGLAELDQRVITLTTTLASSSKEALRMIKSSLWKGSEFTEAQFRECAALSGKLSLDEFCRSILKK